MEDVDQLAPPCTVRHLRPADLERVIAIDARLFGHARRGYLTHKLEVNLLDTSLQVSLGAEIDKSLVGFLLARVWTGEFGSSEPVAVLDTLGVHPDFQKRGIGQALIEQLAQNLRGLNVDTLRTEVDWGEFEVLRFFHERGFRPAARVCLDLPLAVR